MFASSPVIDPLLTSPQRTRQHNADMAALQRLPPLQLHPSSTAPKTKQDAHVSSSDGNDTVSRWEQPYEAVKHEVRSQDVVEFHQDKKNSDSDNSDEEEDAEYPFNQLMNRGSYFRQLRMLALADEQERQASQIVKCSNDRNNANAGNAFCEEKKEDFDDDNTTSHGFDDTSCEQKVALEDKVRILSSTKEKVLDYNSFLAHQRYYDDLKHVDIKYMDYGNITNAEGEDGGQLIVEQRKQLGKGGFCWDAAYILGEHVISLEHEWNNQRDDNKSQPKVIVELGAGTGLSGMMIAKATKSNVVITDLPELADLMRDNIERNFGKDEVVCSNESDNDDNGESMITAHGGKAKGTITSRVLRWGIQEDYEGAPYDVIIGSDIVASLYDPVALARTLHALSGPDTRIYLSGKARLDKPHEEFHEEMHRLFSRVDKFERPESRLRSPNVFVIVAEGKR